MSELEDAVGVVGFSFSSLSKNTSSETLPMDSHGDGDKQTGKEQILLVFLVHQGVFKDIGKAGRMDILFLQFLKSYVFVELKRKQTQAKLVWD